MLTKLYFLQNKYLLIIIAFMAIVGQPVEASKTENCEYRTFNIKINEKVTGLELLSQIADTCNFSIVIHDNFAKAVLDKDLFSINIKNLSLNEVFGVLVSDNNLYYDYTKNFLKIRALNTKTFKVDYITSIRQGSSTLSGSLEGASESGDTESTSAAQNEVSSTDTFDFWTTLQAEIGSILNNGAENYKTLPPIVNQNAGLVTITATKSQLNRVEGYLEVLGERLHKQVLIDVSIMLVRLNESQKTGIDWSEFNLKLGHTTKYENVYDDVRGISPTFDSSLNIVNSAAFNMVGMMDFLSTNGEIRVVSSPKILALNNQPALITVGDTINYKLVTTTNGTDTGATIAQEEEVRSIFVGVLLNITPEVTKDNEIILRINPSVSQLKNELPEDGEPLTIAPDTAEKKLSTVVKINNNNTIILGGLITTANESDDNNVPFLSDIPFLGQAFQSSKKRKVTSELVFVITPRLIGPKDNTKATLKDLGFSKRVYEQ